MSAAVVTSFRVPPRTGRGGGGLRGRIAAGVLVLLLAACAGTPPQGPAAVDLPEAWRAPLPHGGSVTALAGWWRAFADPRLAALIERAQAANPDLQAAAARHRQARAWVREARAALLPRLDASATASRGRNLDNVPGASAQSDTRLEASWEIDLFSARRAAADEQAAQAEATRHDWHAARVTLAADVAAAYVDLRLAQAREEVAELDARLAARLADWGRQQQAAGLASASDVARLQAEAAQAAARRSVEHAEAEVALQALALLLGVPAATLAAELQAPPLPADDGLPRRALPEVPPFAVETLPARLLGQRPDVAAAHQRWLAAVARQRSVDAERYPQLSFGALAGQARVSVGGQTAVSSLWSIGPSLSLPLFDGGVRRARNEAALAAIDEAAATLQAKWQAAVAEVEEALERVQATRERRHAAAGQAQAWQGIARRTERQAQAGLSSGPQRLAAWRDALAAYDEQLAAQAAHAQAWIGLYRSLGGGWQAEAAVVAGAGEGQR